MSVFKIGYNAVKQTLNLLKKSGVKPCSDVISFGAANKSTLVGDTFELSKSYVRRWSKPAEKYILQVKKGEQGVAVPMHHELNGSNSEIRSILDAIKKKSFTRREEHFLPLTLENMHEIDSAFSKLKPLTKDCIGYRGRTATLVSRFNGDFEIIKNAKVGDLIIPDEAYSYLGIHKGLASQFACGSWVKNKPETIMYTIRIPKGAKVSRNLEHGGEIVMPRGAEYRVISKEIEGKHTEITLEYLLPQKDKLKETEELMRKFGVPVVA